MRTVWILGDQLMVDHPALVERDRAETVVLMIESRARGELHRYHQVKLALVYAAMRHRAAALRDHGWCVDYHALQPEGDDRAFEDSLRRHCRTYGSTSLTLSEPNSHLECEVVQRLASKLGLPLTLLPSPQFLLGRLEFTDWARARSPLRMEDHYRRLRQQTGWLMRADGAPEGGAWNFDAQNRRTHAAWRRSGAPAPPLPPTVADPTTREVIALVEQLFPDHPGRASDLWLPVEVTGARRWLRAFIDERLPSFGDFEDMMSTQAPFLLHSVLSPLLNLGLLTPRECIDAALDAYARGAAPLNAVEGYVRQVAGWREFVNGIYWLEGPPYAQRNDLQASRSLPTWFHTGETPMNCLRHVLSHTLRHGWNHHIERLMVLGNFLLIADVRPQEALRWFLEMYVDAYDWVMAANVIGLSQYADVGLTASKPYLASGNYIRRMSDYCEGCRFDPDTKSGPRACPFTLLYWDFIDRHADHLAGNPRMRPVVHAWQQRPEGERSALRAEARQALDRYVP